MRKKMKWIVLPKNGDVPVIEPSSTESVDDDGDIRVNEESKWKSKKQQDDDDDDDENLVK